MDSKKRASVSLGDFLKVTVVDREQFNTADIAANELGMTIGSFKQRLMKERKAYPDIFSVVPKYKSGTRKRRPTQEEAIQLLESLKN